MKFSLSKRFFLFLLVLVIKAASADSTHSIKCTDNLNCFQEKLGQLEKEANGRLGVYAINTANHQKLEYRADERFPFCSTSKVIVVSAMLKKSEKNPELLQKKIMYTSQDIEKSGYIPITEKSLDQGMTIAELGKAAIEYSDSGAMNLLINQLGGLEPVNEYAKSIGDPAFRIDRFEPDINSAIPGDHRDTTTPTAMGASLQKLTLGDALQSPQRELLLDWLKNNTTGNFKIRAGVPKNWIVGDKTGGGKYNTANDIAIVWPPHCAPIVMVVYFTGHQSDGTDQSNVLAETARLIISEFAQHDQCLKSALGR